MKKGIVRWTSEDKEEEKSRAAPRHLPQQTPQVIRDERQIRDIQPVQLGSHT
jgi:hypothetical protein